jgi:hypothetical protein
MRDKFTIGELADVAADGNESVMRQMLRKVGADLELRPANPSETVDRGWVVDLFALHASDRLGRALRALLVESIED